MELQRSVSILLTQLRQRDGNSVLVETNERKVTALEFLTAVDQASQWLREAKIARLGLLLDNEPAWLVWDIAAQNEGICLIPLPTFFSAEQISHIVESAGVTHVVSAPELQGLLVSNQLRRIGLSDIPLCTHNSVYCVTSVREPHIPAGTHKITFTSGSTGKPKGVCLSTQHCLAVAQAIADRVSFKSPRHLCTLPLSTLLENLAGIYQTWLQDGSVVLYPLAYLGFDGGRLTSFNAFVAAMNQAQPESMITVPALLMAVVKAGQAGLQLPNTFKFVAVGGARVAPRLVEQALSQGIPVFEGYGLSECASVVAINTPEGSRAGTSGKVLDHLKLSTVDGEIVVEGPLFLGYMDQPETWGLQRYETGDLGDITSDQFVRISGRKKNVVITTLGRNIAPEWIEGELFAEGIFDQCVVLGNNLDQCALVCYAPSAVQNSAIDVVIKHLNGRLPPYAQLGQWLRLSGPLTVQQGLWTENGRPKREAIASEFTVKFLDKEDGVYDVL